MVMEKTMKKIVIMLATILIFSLTACTNNPEIIEFPEVKTSLDETFNAENNEFIIEEDILLPNVVEGAIISYVSSDSSVLSESGQINRPTDEDIIITLTVTIKKSGNEEIVIYTVTILKTDSTDVNGDYKIIEDQRVLNGALVISGGASTSNLNKIDDAFIGLGGGNEHIHILIIPTSSGGPTSSSVNAMKNSYKGRYGLTEEQFSVLNVTSSTKQLADDPSEVDKVNNATAIWFTGGDQYLVTSSLWKSNGTPSLVLQAIFDKWEDGNIVIGGSSAGAAIMSKVMIGGGLSVGALSYDHVNSRSVYNGDDYNYGALLVNETGFGFFEHGVIDQHFDARDRLGRLIEATYVTGNKGLGFGVAENSALIYNNDTLDISVIGELFIIDTREASRTKTSTNLSKYENIKISLLRGSSTYNITTEEFTFLREDGNLMTNITNSPQNLYKYPTNISPFSGEYQSLYEFIGDKLLNNRKTHLYIGRNSLPYISSFTITDHEYYRELNSTSDRIIYEKRFLFDVLVTEGYYDATTKEYSFKQVILDIIPLQDNLTEAN
jgi:cyanophycinase